MGVKLGDVVKGQRISMQDLAGKTVAIDAYNAMYQFLAIIRQRDGTPLRDHTGRITSHLSGLLYRTVNFLEIGIKPVYVFDGTPPAIKEAEIKRRKRLREEALLKYEEALKRGDLEEARKYAQQTAQLKDYMVEDAKRLLTALGIPWVQAPSEGEAQAAYMARKGDVWACASQDFDSLLFGAPRLVRNLTIRGERKLPGKNVYVKIEPELIILDNVLKELGITREQLIDVAILVGTDYNPEGIKGVGPKRALQMIKSYGSLERIPGISPKDFPEDPAKIRELFLNPKVTDDYRLEWREPDFDAVIEFLCEERDFSRDRVTKALERAARAIREITQKTTLEQWFF